MKKWEELQLTLSNSKSEEGQGDYWNKTQNLFKTTRGRVELSNSNFCRFGSEVTSQIV